MPRKILVIPDKFKGTLTAQAAAQAIVRGWKSTCPTDELEMLPMSDGGDGFGQILSDLIEARPQKVKTVNAAHEPIEATWWWDRKTKTAVIESAKVIGLAMLPPGKFHPFQLDTFGLGEVLLAAAKRGARVCVVGIGGSATNDGGFGMALALGWKFLHKHSHEIATWTHLGRLTKVVPPKGRRLFDKMIVAVDVKNPLLGRKGCSRVYGPQKGLRTEDFAPAESCLRRLNGITKGKRDYSKIPGAGAAGGLGFGMMTFAGAQPRSGFDLFAEYSDLRARLRTADLVITGEGALDHQTLMGKGVGRLALLCKAARVPCIGLAGVVAEPARARRLFARTAALVDITTLAHATNNPARHLEELAALAARR